MKNLKKIFAIFTALALLGVVSCNLNPFSEAQQESASFTIDLGALRSLSFEGKGFTEVEVARIYLMAGASYLQFDSYSSDPNDPPPVFAEKVSSIDVTDNITIERLYPGDQYRILLSLSETASTDPVFLTDFYGNSVEVFSIVASEEPVDQEIEVQASPFSPGSVMGSPVSSIAVIGGTIYVHSGDTIYYGSAPGTPDGTITMPSGYSIYSISQGTNESSKNPELWINTNKGIVPYRDKDLITTFSEALLRDHGTDGKLPIHFSGTYTMESAMIVFYLSPDEGEGAGLGGVIAENDDPTSWSWFDISQVTDEPGFEALGDYLKGEVIYDFVATEKFGYFVTIINAFGVSETIKDDIATIDFTEITFDQISGLANFISVKEGGESLSIYTVAQEKDKLYLGTNKGVWINTIDPETGELIGKPNKIENTDGYEIKKMVSAVDDTGNIYVAAITDSDLLIVKNDAIHQSYSFHTGLPGLPGELNSIIWDGGSLYIGGKQGFVALSVF